MRVGESFLLRVALWQNARQAYAMAVALAAVGLGLRFAFGEVLPTISFFPFFPMVLLSGALCGLGPGILTLLLSLAVGWYFFLPPAPLDVQAGRMVFFALSCVIALVVLHYLRVVIRRLEKERSRATLAVAEINHRVKNSLQIVSSMLRLQSMTVPAETQAALQQASSRVDTVARLHLMLADSDEISMIKFDDYLRELCRSMSNTWQAAGLAISCDIECDKITVPTGRGVSLALIVNELLTNIAKYAYPEGAGKAVITCKKNGGELVVRVSDQGVGLPAGFDPAKSTGLGMRIITSLATQIGARVEIGRSDFGGAAIALTVPAA